MLTRHNVPFSWVRVGVGLALELGGFWLRVQGVGLPSLLEEPSARINFSFLPLIIRIILLRLKLGFRLY
jgi:hypothetical protein